MCYQMNTQRLKCRKILQDMYEILSSSVENGDEHLDMNFLMIEFCALHYYT